MSTAVKQHLIDPEICIRCYSCEAACPIDAIEHGDENVVVDPDICNFCMACIPVCPTGSIDEWRVVTEHYSLEQQHSWEELPQQQEFPQKEDIASSIEAFDDSIEALLAEAHSGTGGKPKAPKSSSKPTVNLYTLGKPVEAVVKGNYRLTEDDTGTDVRHIILSFEDKPFPYLEGQSIGIIAPGTAENGEPHLPRLYSVSSPRDGERQNYNNLSLTVKREEKGVCSNYVCDLEPGDKVNVTGPFGATFLLSNDEHAKLLMICTGTGSAPFRAFTMRRQRLNASREGNMTLFFGARSPSSLPYFGPLSKIPDHILRCHMAFSRASNMPKAYVQDHLLAEGERVSELLRDEDTYIYICGLRAMEEGVEAALDQIAESAGMEWSTVKAKMREEGRYHVETY